MKLLAFETATEACSVAVWVDGDVRERFELAPRRHAELALPWAEALLAEAGIARAQLDAVAVGRGPGAFTGVRLAISLAQGIALALDRPIVPVSTLATLAMQGQGRVLAAIDARMGEVYLGAFAAAGGDVAALGREVVVAPGQASLQDLVAAPSAATSGTHAPGADPHAASVEAWQGIGTGFAAADAALQARLGGLLQRIDAAALPRAADTARLAAAAFARGEALAPERAEPAYLRDHVALTLAEQQARGK